MPDKPVTVAAYAAGASLAAITLFYVFGPTFFLDGEHSSNTSDGRKGEIIGLSNPANDCFINSVLQALAGLGDLRLYLIRELHRRELDGPEMYSRVPDDLRKGKDPNSIRDLQHGLVTEAMKDMLDALNERPICKKTISARPLIEALERAFRTRISRNQQDAQEFLQIVTERLSDEYHAAVKARERVSRQLNGLPDAIAKEDQETEVDMETALEKPDQISEKSDISRNDDGFPFEGKIESQIRCQFCNFKTKPSATTFVTLTLNVPQKSSTTLDNCFDMLLKTEDIEGFKCDKCRLTHALKCKIDELGKCGTEKGRSCLENDIELIEKALVDDPEKAPAGVELPNQDKAPKRNIKRFMRITLFPKIMAIHLSRSVYDPRSYSSKNHAKVAYPERLRVGGLLDEKWYKLLSIVCHKGSHNSGHYESFRRNHVYPPFATPGGFSAYAASSRNGNIIPTIDPSPQIPPTTKVAEEASALSQTDTSLMSKESPSPDSSRPSSESPSALTAVSRTSSPQPGESKTPLGASTLQSDATSGNSVSKTLSKPQEAMAKFRKRKKSNDRWWRISDDKIKECKTAEALAMQREVYLLFYELERPGDEDVV